MMPDDSSSDEENTINFTSKDSTKQKNLLGHLRNRELGLRNSKVIRIKASLSFSDVDLYLRKSKDDCEQLQLLSKAWFCKTFSGFMGITYDGKYLVAVRIWKNEKHLYFFLLYPFSAVLHRILKIEGGNGVLYHIKAYSPSKGTKYVAAYTHDEAEFKCLTSKENNLSVQLTMSPSDYELQVNITSLIVIVSRIVAKTVDRKSLKHYAISHENGVILNTGICLVNHMFSDKNIVTGDARKVWAISRQPCYSWEQAKKSKPISLELGESVGISACSDFFGDNTPYEYQLHFIKSKSCLMVPDDSEMLPIVFVRDTFHIENWLFRAIDKYLRKEPKYQGCALRALRDYEADVSEVEGYFANVQAFALCEIEVLKETFSSVNEFHLFKLTVQWDLENARLRYTTSPYHISKIDHRFVVANRWWPLQTSGAVTTTAIHQSVNNLHILRGSRICQQMVTCDGQLELTYEQEDFE